MIKFQNFSFKYRAQKENTLKEINLNIHKGEKILIVGPSGSGKSTIAQCINSMIPTSYQGDYSGIIEVDNKNPMTDGIFEMSSAVGTVLQDPDSQFIAISAGEDIAFVLENDCMDTKKMHDIVYESAKIVKMEDFLEYKPHNLSGGQKQRIALAGILGDDVDILLFDEPLANLDPATGKLAIELIDDIHKKTNKTIIIIEHRLEDVLHRHIDRIALIDDGKVVAFDTPDNIISTNLLIDAGIREPLYITALKYANCDITSDMHPDHIDNINLNNIKEKVINWEKQQIDNKMNIENKGIIEFNDIHFGYLENKKILNGINFKINKGEMVSIVGKNGAGKSTISKIICGFYKPNSGSIYVNGEDISSLSIKKRAEHIGLVMQNPNQMISKSMIYDEVALGLIARNIPEHEIQKRVEEVLKICGLYEFRNWPISALSFGQKKRVTIASILVLDPEIIILDEPTAGQDFRHYTEIMEFLKKLNKERNITVIMITHDMHLMLEYTDRAIAIADGNVIADMEAYMILTNENIVRQANLNITSLFTLANKVGIEDPYAFVKKFIQYDKKVRK